MLSTGSNSLIGLAALATAAQAVSLAASTQGPRAVLSAELEGLGAEAMMAQTAAEADFWWFKSHKFLAETDATRGRAKRGLGRSSIADIQADAPTSSKASGSYLQKGGQWVYENREEIAEVALEVAQQGLEKTLEIAEEAKQGVEDAWNATQDYAAQFAGVADTELEFICQSTGVCYKEGLKELEDAYEKAEDFANNAMNEVMNAEQHAQDLARGAQDVAENVAREMGDITGRIGRNFVGAAEDVADWSGAAWNDAAGAVNHMAGNIGDMATDTFNDVASWGWLAEITEEERQKISFALDLEDGSIENTTDPEVMQAILDLLDLGSEFAIETALPVDDIMSNYQSYGNQASFDLNF